MVKELLVLITCLNQKGCAQASTAYYQESPQLKTQLDRNKRQITKTLGKDITATLPVVMLAIEEKGTVLLYKNFSLQFSQTKGLILFETSF